MESQQLQCLRLDRSLLRSIFIPCWNYRSSIRVYRLVNRPLLNIETLVVKDMHSAKFQFLKSRLWLTVVYISLVIGIEIGTSNIPVMSQPTNRPSRQMILSRPAPPPSRYGYSLKIDLNSLPKGVTIEEVGEFGNVRLFITNSSNIPLIINENIDYIGRLVHANKLVSGKVYGYFPSGIPMEGKTHLKGWQEYEKVNKVMLSLARSPSKIDTGRKRNLSKILPEPESVSIPANYDGRPYEIKGFVHYHLNKRYDEDNLNQ
jgi:hypothetical protein